MQLQTWTQDSLQHRLPQIGKVDWDSEDSMNLEKVYSLLKDQVAGLIEALGVMGLQREVLMLVFCGCFFPYLLVHTLPLSP